MGLVAAPGKVGPLRRLWQLGLDLFSHQPSERVRETLRIIVEVAAFGGQRFWQVLILLGVLLLDAKRRHLRQGRHAGDAGQGTTR